MEITKNFENHFLKISISGELDASSAIDMDEAMKDAFEKNNLHILINCRNLKYISSAGLGVFVSYLEDFKAKKGQFVFYNMSEAVFNTFQILGLDKIMTIVQDEPEAKKTIQQS